MLPKIIAFHGPQGSGKTTALQYLEVMLLKMGKRVRTIKFAAPLYRIQNYIYEQAGFPHPTTKDRELLQYIGTDWARSKDPAVWVNIYKKTVREMSYGSVDIILTDDCRFENEAVTIHQLSGSVVKMLGPQRIEVINGSHSSESELPDMQVDFFLRNDQDLEYLNHNLKLLLEHLGIKNG